MSELINTRDNRATIRWKLLTSASALALTAAVSTVTVARAEDADRPLIWIELGGQMEHVGGQGAVFSPAFLAANPNSPVLGSVTPLQAQQPSTFSFGEEAKISYRAGRFRLGILRRGSSRSFEQFQACPSPDGQCILQIQPRIQRSK